jgi:hypothetical protein
VQNLRALSEQQVAGALLWAEAELIREVGYEACAVARCRIKRLC